MPGSKYLPSAQFIVIVSAIALSGGLVLAAQYITKEPTPSSLSSSNNAALQGTYDWKAALYDVQGTDPLAIQSSASVQASLDALLEQAQTDNVTDTIGRSLLVSLSKAKTEGLGSDIPTQEKLLNEAANYLQPAAAQIYTIASLSIIPDSPASLKAYGNAFIEALSSHPAANMQDTYVAVGNAVDKKDASYVRGLDVIAAAYKEISEDLLAVPVPKTLSPLHLQITNNFSRIAASFTDMKTITVDPLRGFGGMQTYNSLTAETTRMFTNIAQSFSKNGILFDTDEPGAAWSVFLPQ